MSVRQVVMSLLLLRRCLWVANFGECHFYEVVNKGLSSLVCRLSPEPGGPSRDDYGPPDGYKLAYSVPCANPYQHLSEEAPRLHTPIHVPKHVAPDRRVLPLLQICVSDDQDGRYSRGAKRAEQSGDELVPPHQVGGD